MAANIANTTLSTGAKDNLAVVDVYKETSTKPINLTPKTNVEIKGAAEAARNNADTAKDAKVRASLPIPQTVPETIELIDRLSNLTNNSRGAINGLPAHQLTELLDILGMDANSGVASVMMDGVRYSNKSHKDASSFVQLLNAITGNSDLARVLDLESESALMGMLLKQAIALNIPKAIDKILDRISDEKLKKRLLIENLESAARMSDLETVNKVIDEIGVPAALVRVPNLINMILMYYSFHSTKRNDIDKSERTLTALRNKLLALLSRITPGWYTTYREGVPINNLEPYTYASKDALSLLISDPNHRHNAMVAPKHKSGDLYFFLRKSYPRAPFFGTT